MYKWQYSLVWSSNFRKNVWNSLMLKTRQHIRKQRQYFANKGPSSQSYGFSNSHVWVWDLDRKKAEWWIIDAFELWCWKRLLKVPWAARRSNQSILKEISPECSGLNMKDWCWSWNSNTLATWCEERTHWKRPLCWKRLKAGGEGDDRGWDGWMESPTWWTSVWTGDGDCQGSLVCCCPWGRKELDMTERLNWLMLN